MILGFSFIESLQLQSKREGKFQKRHYFVARLISICFSMKILRVTILLFLLPFFVAAQDISTGWEAHFSYNHIVDLIIKDNKIYAASENAVFTYDIHTSEMHTISTVDGLDGGSITSFGYSVDSDMLLVGYENGLLQLVDLEEITVRTFVDIVEKHSIQANKKRINHIRMEGNHAYISTDYGISVFNMSRQEFGDTYYIGYLGSQLEVKQTAVFNGHIYAATPGGIKRALASNPNLIDSSQWFTREAGDYKAVQVIGGELYAWRGGREVQRLENDNFVTIYTHESDIIDFRTSRTNIVLTTLTKGYAFTPDFTLESEMYIGVENLDVDALYTVGTAEDGMFFMGTNSKGILHNGFSGGTNLQIIPDGPLHNNVFTVDAYNEEVWIGYGDVTFGYNPYPIKERGISKLQEAYWINIPFQDVYDANDLVKVRINKQNPSEVYFTSYQKGLLQVKDDIPTKLYNQTNSVLSIGKGSASFGIRLYGLDFDRDGNLWTVQTGVRHGLIRFTPEGGSTKVDLDGVIPYDRELSLTDLVVTKEGYIFFGTAHNGVVGYNPQTKKFNRIRQGTTGGLTGGYNRALAVDLQDRLWIGTGRGLRVLQNTSNFFNVSNPVARQIIIMDGEVAQELLFEIPINAITVDGSNNKWIATSTSGAFYVSATGQETIHHFTKDNSPLPSNDVQDIAVDPESGKVYLATTRGLMSFQGTATAARNDLGGLHAFPNPVRPEYDGMVTVSGLMTNTNVKITDLEGNLVFETTSQGGTVQWDTRAFGRHKVASGVYFIMANANDGTTTKVAKIMIIR